MVVAVQLSAPGLYLPPVFRKVGPTPPPQTSISLPVHTAVWPDRAPGALVVLVAVQLSVLGLYLPPVFTKVGPVVPHPRRSFQCPSTLPSGPPGHWARSWCWWLSTYTRCMRHHPILEEACS